MRVTRESQPVTAIADALEPFVDAGEVAGLVALVARGDDAEVTVLGDQAIGGSPMREDSMFRVASAGKPVTAAAALALVADGRLTLDQPVDDLLPELAQRRVLREPSAALDDTVPAVRPVTVRDLLRSTSGLGFSSDFTAPISAALFERLNQGPPRPQDFAPPDEWIARVGELPLIHQPGEGFTYNTAYDILTVLIARASGRSFDDHLAERILEPLGMVDTGSRSHRARLPDQPPHTVAPTKEGWWSSTNQMANSRVLPCSHRAPAATCRPRPTCSASNGCCWPVAATSCPADGLPR